MHYCYLELSRNAFRIQMRMALVVLQDGKQPKLPLKQCQIWMRLHGLVVRGCRHVIAQKAVNMFRGEM